MQCCRQLSICNTFMISKALQLQIYFKFNWNWITDKQIVIKVVDIISPIYSYLRFRWPLHIHVPLFHQMCQWFGGSPWHQHKTGLWMTKSNGARKSSLTLMQWRYAWNYQTVIQLKTRMVIDSMKARYIRARCWPWPKHDTRRLTTARPYGSKGN